MLSYRASAGRRLIKCVIVDLVLQRPPSGGIEVRTA
jgi:hypothetical protein